MQGHMNEKKNTYIQCEDLNFTTTGKDITKSSIILYSFIKFYIVITTVTYVGSHSVNYKYIVF
jgi:hypothetical protein